MGSFSLREKDRMRGARDVRNPYLHSLTLTLSRWERELSRSATLRSHKPFHVLNQVANLLIFENPLIGRHKR